MAKPRPMAKAKSMAKAKALVQVQTKWLCRCRERQTRGRASTLSLRRAKLRAQLSLAQSHLPPRKGGQIALRCRQNRTKFLLRESHLCRQVMPS